MGTKPFSEQEKVVRTALNLSQEELAYTLGASFAMVNRWENGKTHLSRLAQHLFELFCEEHKKQRESGSE